MSRPRLYADGPLTNFNLRLPQAIHALLKGAASIHARTPADEARLAFSIHGRRTLLQAIDGGWLDNLAEAEVGGKALAARRDQIAAEVAELEREAFARPEVGAVLAQALGEVAANN